MAAAVLSVMGRSAVGSPTTRTSRSPPRARGSGAAKMRASMRRTKLAASTSMSLRSSVSENSTRMAGMSASPNAVSDRLDVQQSFQELFYDKTAEEVKNFSRFNAMALDRDDNADSIEQLKRKMRAASYRDGGQNWDKLFQQYDRDGSGELDLEEFTRAIRRDAGVTRAIFSDDDLDRLFKRIDVDSSGEINAEEFAQFIAWKPSARAAEHAGTDGMSYAEKLQLRNTGVPFVAEYICVRRAVLREGPSLDSPKVGTLEPGEVVAVVRSQGIRLKCVRLRWGDKPSGWASERADGGVGETMLEKLPRGEWSAVEKNDTAIATRVSSLRSAQLIQQMLQEERVRNNEDADAYWSAPLKKFLKEGRLREDAKLPEPPPGWTRTVLATPRGMAAADLIGGCESVEDVSAVLDALETKDRDDWPEEVERQRSEISINEEASRIWSEASFTAVDRAMQRRNVVGALSSMSSEDLASSKPWTGPREIKYTKKPSPPVDAATASAGDINSDVEIVGAQKVQEALEQVAALIAAAEEEGVDSQQLAGLRQSMEQLRQAL